MTTTETKPQAWTDQEMDIVGDESNSLADCLALLPHRTSGQIAGKRGLMARKHRLRTGSKPDVRYWTEEEVAILLDNKDKTSKALGLMLGRSKSSVEGKRYDLEERYRPRKGIDRRKWTQNDDLLLESMSDITAAQAAEILGRTVAAINSRRGELKIIREGESNEDRLATYANPNCVPRTGILLAKTCLQCGKLMDAAWFNSRAAVCRGCKRGDVDRVKNAERRAKDREKYRQSRRDFYQKMQQLTTPAERKGEEYTSSDHEILSDPNRTTLSKALELKRSYAAVASAIYKGGYTSLTPTLGDQEHAVWHIAFPEQSRKELAA